MELKWLRGNPPWLWDREWIYSLYYSKKAQWNHLFRTACFYFDESPARKTQEDRNLFSHTGLGPALNNFRISEVLCFLPLPQKEAFISDAVKAFPELKNIIEPNKRETLDTEQHDYRFDLDYDT